LLQITIINISNMAIQSGTMVWLKSGSPKMTAKHTNNVREWVCSWFVETELKQGAFHPDQLTETDPNAKKG
jgi:uncharacterized protein YodC (DUF2158 family)